MATLAAVLTISLAQAAEPRTPFEAARQFRLVSSDSTVAKQLLTEILDENGIDDAAQAASPFLSRIKLSLQFQTRNAGLLAQGSQKARTVSAATNATGAFPAFSAQSVADAFGTWIATRLQNDAEAAFLRQFREKILTPELRSYLEKLFPRALAYIDQLDPQQIHRGDLIGTLKAHLNADVRELPDHLGEFLDVLEGQTPLGDGQYLARMAVLTAAQISSGGVNSYALIERLHAESERLAARVNSSGSAAVDVVRAAVLASRALSIDRASHWADPGDFRNVFGSVGTPAELDAWNLWLGLCLHQNQTLFTQIRTSSGHPLAVALATLPVAQVGEFLRNIESLAKRLRKIETDIAKLKARGDEAEPVNYRDIATDLAALAEAVKAFKSFLPAAVDEATFLRAAKTIEWLVDLYCAVEEKDYVRAASDLWMVVPQWLDPKSKLAEFLKSDKGALLMALPGLKTSDDVKSFLFTHAGGNITSGIKEQESMFALNAYFGLVATREKLRGGGAGAGANGAGYTAGFTAPVGIQYSWPGKFLCFRSQAVFLSVIDVGAVATWRFKDGSSTLPPLTWSNIMAPGAHYVAMFKNSHLGLKIGSQYGPELRKVKVGGVETERAAWQQITIGVTYDLPVFRFR